NGGMPPIHIPFFLEAGILSRMRLPGASRSNWAKESRTFRGSRPMSVVVLNCWVIDTRDAAAVEDLDELGKIGERAGQPVDLIDDDHIDLACLDIGDQPFQGRPLHRAAGKPAIIIDR